jgi:O-antigen/teichoic acid export membrane protein
MKRLFWFRSAASIVDHMMLSGVNFLIGLVLIRFATKETYGLYSQLSGVTILTTSLLEAMIGTALTTLAARVTDAERVFLVARAFRLQMVIALAFATACGLGVFALSLYTPFVESASGLAVAFFALVLTLSCRECCRTALYLQSRPEVVAAMDLGFVVATMLGGAAVLVWGHASVTGVVALLAVTNGLAAGYFAVKLLWPHNYHDASLHSDQDFRALWSLSRWALTGAIVAWLVNNGYLYFAGGLLGVAALADLNAARLLLVPVSIVAMAWVRVARPVIGQSIVAKNWLELGQFNLRSTLAMTAFAAFYVGLLMWAFPWLAQNVFGEKYQHVAELLVIWGVYFALNCARNVGTTTLISFGAYRATFWQGLSSVPILMLGCLLAIPKFGVRGALGAMIFVEFCELLTNWFYLLPKARRGDLTMH